MHVSSPSPSRLLEHFLRRDPEVETRVADCIEHHRKGEARLRFVDEKGEPVEGARVGVRQTRHDFLFGANIFTLGGFDSEERNLVWERAFLDVFNSAVAPFYWADLEPEQGRPRFDADSPRLPRRPPPDVVLDFCERHRLAVKGHCLAWHQWLPSWLPGDSREVSRLSRERIREIGRRYGDRFDSWDVVNEPMERFMFPKAKALPEDYVAEAFEAAEEVIPPGSKLILNEATAFSWREFHGGTTGLHLLARNLLLRGRRVDAIGLQYHLFFYDENGLTRTVRDLEKNRDLYLDPRRLLSVLDLHARLGKPVHISEITLPVYPDFDDAERFQADLLRELYRLWFGHPAVEGIYWWNVADGTAHGKEAALCAGLLRPDLSPKPAYETLRRLVREEWCTRLELETDGDGCSFRGFYGDYEVTVEHAGHRVTHSFGLHRGAANDFRLVVSPISDRPAIAPRLSVPYPTHA